MTTNNRIVRVIASLNDPSIKQFMQSSYEFNVLIPKDVSLERYWANAFGDSVKHVIHVINDKVYLTVDVPEDEHVAEAAAPDYLRNVFVGHGLQSRANLLLTGIAKTYSEEHSPFQDYHERLHAVSVKEINSLVDDASYVRTSGNGEVSEDLWKEAVDAVSTLRIQAGIELNDINSLLEVLDDCLDTSHMEELLGGKGTVALTKERAEKQHKLTSRKMGALIKLEKKLYRLAGKKAHPMLLEGVRAYN